MDEYDSILLDLSEVKSCSKKTVYKRVNIGTREKEKFENQVDKIVLDFDFLETRQAVQILFFEPVMNHIFTTTDWNKKPIQV